MSVLFKDKITGLWKRAAAQFIYSPVPVGTVSAYGGDTAPTGYMLCHGQALNSADYPDLYAVIGTAYGTGDGSAGSFSLPDLQNKTTFGIGSAVGGLSRLGDKTVGSLPDINGTFYLFNGWGAQSVTSGAFYPGASNLNSNAVSGTAAGQIPMYFSASRSSSMYKSTSQVVPSSVGVEYIIKVTK